MKVDLVSYEVTDTFDYPLAITSDFKGGTTHIEDLEELLGSKDYPLLVSENK